MIANHATAFGNVTLQQPSRIAFGAGCRLQVADHLIERGVQSVLIFASRSVFPIAHDLIGSIKAAGIQTTLGPPPPPEPTFDDARRAIEATRNSGADAVIGLGGGSVIDVAKIAAACARLDNDLADFVGVGRLPPRTLALMAMPTTAGAGSEVSPNAVFLDADAEMKQAIISPWLMPDAAFVDPELACSLPRQATATTALDALSHCIEAFANKRAHPAVDLYALEGARLIFRNLPSALAQGDNIEARSALALGSLYGGLCLGPVNTAAIHALSYPLGSRYHVAHGAANAMLMPRVLRYNAVTAPERYAALGAALGLSPEGDVFQQAESAIDAISQLCVSSGIPMSLSHYGVARSAIPQMATEALKVTRLLVNNLREVTWSDAVSIYQDTF